MSDHGGYRSYAGDDLVTGEGVAVEVPTASVAARMASAAIDVILALALLIGGFFVFGMALGDATEAMVGIVGIAWSTFVIVGIPAALETFTRGRTLGKMAPRAARRARRRRTHPRASRDRAGARRVRRDLPPARRPRRSSPR